MATSKGTMFDPTLVKDLITKSKREVSTGCIMWSDTDSVQWN